ncbi:MAG: cupin domain-containing protein [Bacteroidales bacterium]|nr:cupin domain-containing protein [Bacteroidales bacterium]
MKTVKYKDCPIIDTPHKIDARKMYDKDSAQAIQITLKPGEALKPHITPVDVFFYVLEGTPHVLVDDEKIEVQADTLVESPKDTVHCLYNDSQTIARILVVKAPKPIAKTKLL